MRLHPIHRALLPLLLSMAATAACPEALLAQAAGPGVFRFDSYTINEGISESIVSAIAEDKYGEICIGTEKGMDIFNGYDFQNVESHTPAALRDGGENGMGIIYRIQPLANGLMFIKGHDQYSFLFNPANRRFIPLDSLVVPPLVGRAPGENYRVQGVNCVLQTRQGDIWIGTPYGLMIAPAQEEVFPGLPRLLRKVSRDSSGIIGLAQDTDGRVWALTVRNELLLFDAHSRTLLHRIPSTRLDIPPRTPACLVLHAGSSGDIWIGSPHGVYRFAGMQGKLPALEQLPLVYQGHPYGDLPVNCLLRDASGLLWIGTQAEGILLYDVYAGRVVDRFLHTPFYSGSVNSNTILCLTEDSHHRIWIGTDNGLNKYDRYAQKFALYNTDLSDPTRSLSLVFSIVGVDSVRVMALSRNRPVLLNTRTHAISEVALGPELGPDTWFGCLSADAQGLIWATSSAGLTRIRREGGRYVARRVEAPELKPLAYAMPHTLLTEGDSVIWLGMYEEGAGLARWDRRNHILRRYERREGDPRSLSGRNVSSLFRDRKGRIWVGTKQGLSRYNPRSDDFDNFLESAAGSTISSHPEGMYDDGKHIWVASFSGGLYRLDPATGAYTRYTMADGLPDNTLYACMGDDSGCLWISTNKGISQFLVKERKFRNFTKEDGLQSDEFDGGSVYRNAKGEIFFGGVYGINKIDPAHLELDTVPTPVMVSNLAVLSTRGGRDIFPGDQRRFEFPYWQNMLLFQFTALNFTAPSANRYQYRLKGLDHGWTYAGNKHSVIYSHIPPGNYTFQVAAMNEDGSWSPEPTVLHLVIRPPFWGTTWFKVLATLAALLLLYGLFRLRLRALRRAHQEKMERASMSRKILQLEKMALQAQMNPHFIFNSLNSIKAYILASEPEEAAEYLNDFANLIRKILQNSKKERISLEEELQAIERYVRLEERRLRRKIHLTVSTRGDLCLSAIYIPPLIIQPFIENAIWHGIRPTSEEGRIQILIREEGDRLRVSITDNGVGRETARRHRSGHYKAQSLGVSITQQRLSHFNGRKIENIQYEDLRDPAGTKVTLWIHQDETA